MRWESNPTASTVVSVLSKGMPHTSEVSASAYLIGERVIVASVGPLFLIFIILVSPQKSSPNLGKVANGVGGALSETQRYC